MISRYEATLNGVPLSSLSPQILILDISYSDPSYSVGTYSFAGRNGARPYRWYKERASVTISFVIRAYNINARQEICQLINSWAKDGGTLEVNDRANQFLVCECEKKPFLNSVMRWTDPITMVFTAYVLPYWQNSSENRVVLSGLQATGSLILPGSAPETFVGVNIKANQALTYVSLEAGDTKIDLRGLSIASGGQIVLDYTDDMIMRIMSGNTSLLSKRSGSDDLIAVCGGTTRVKFVSDGNCEVEFHARGLWE